MSLTDTVRRPEAAERHAGPEPEHCALSAAGAERPPRRFGLRGAAGFVAVAVALGVATAISRIPFRSRYLFSWDSANFALALDQYNVTFHQPQPPGYPLYVASAWLIRHVAGEANASYVALSIGASALAVTCLALAAERLYGRFVALLAAVVLATSSLFWGQGEVAYPYAFLAAFTSLIAWLCLVALGPKQPAEPPEVQDGTLTRRPPLPESLHTRQKRGDGRSDAIVVLIAALIGTSAGFRSELLAFLSPLWLYAALCRPAAWRRRIVGVALGSAAMALVVAAWYVPMVSKSGGWTAYQQATGGYYAYFVQSTSGAGKLLLGILENSRALIGFVYNGLGLALVPMLYFAGRFFSPQRAVADWRARFMLVWLLPPVVFYVAVHIGNPGYALSIVPALCIFAVVATLGFVEDVREAATMVGRRGPVPNALARRGWALPAAAGIVAVVAATNAALFVFGTGEGRRGEIRQIDRILERQVAYVREQYPAASTAIVAYDRSRQYHYYLPEHRIELLFDRAVAGAVTDTSRYWERRSTYVVPPGVDSILFPDLGRNTSDQPGLAEHVDLGDGVELWAARVRPGDEVRFGYQYASVQRR